MGKMKGDFEEEIKEQEKARLNEQIKESKRQAQGQESLKASSKRTAGTTDLSKKRVASKTATRERS